MNTTEFLQITGAICPQKTAIVFEGERFSYADISERSNRLAHALSGLGVVKGDRVAILQVNCNKYVEAYFATAKLAGIFVPLNFRAKADELTYMINNSEAKVLLVGKRYVEMVHSIQRKLKSIKHYISLEGKEKRMSDYDELLASASSDEVVPDSQDDDVSVLMFTAGTTGFPKGVMLTHNNFSSYILSNVTPADPELEEKNILTVPLYHIAGIQAVLSAVYGGRTLVIQRQFEAEEWMRLVQAEGVSRAMMVPTMLKQLMDHPKFG
ncbi:MAG: AMP-binding protein, partial [Chloroflexi bacterium]|nr:AMP-binding protein [Chloroflexota bacterium]